ncbi:MAG: hypothetical protein OEV92_05730 [Nitrospinota bacterium]|nr:hypothetical protein [Nitrospinota bacterium]
MRRIFAVVFACAALHSTAGVAQEAFSISLKSQWTANRSAATALAFHGQGCGLLIGNEQGKLFYWLADESKNPQAAGSISGPAEMIIFHPLQNKAFIANRGAISQWSQSTGVTTFATDSGSQTSRLAIDLRGEQIATGGESGGAVIWNTATGRKISDITARHEGGIVSLGFAKEGQLLLTLGKDRATRLWDWRTQRKVREIEEDQGDILSADFNPQANILAIGKTFLERRRLRGGFGGQGIHSSDVTFHHLVAIVNTLTGERVKLLHDPASPPNDFVALTPDARFAIAASAKGSARVWDVKKGDMVTRLSTDSGVTSIAICPTGRMMAIGEKSGAVSLYEMRGVYPVATGAEGLDRHSLLSRLAPDQSALPSVAVFNLKPGADDTRDLAGPLSDALRSAVSSSGQYRLVEREKLDQIMEELALKQAGLCESLECQSAAVNLTGADKFINGSIARLGKNFAISLYLLNSKTGEIENSVTRTCACSPEDLLALMDAVTAELMRKL